MKIALAQMRNEGSIEKNLEKSLFYIRLASEQGADLIVFPEVQLTEFFPQYPKQDVKHYGVTLEGDIVKAFQNACRENEIMASPNLYLSQDGKYYDTSFLIDKDGSILGLQKMVHVAYAEQFYETDYYTPADDGFKVFDTALGKIGIVVCFDRHYPESIRTEALRGADLILIPTVNTKSEPLEMFEQEIRVQAFHNSVAVAMVNRVGAEGEMDFAGESLVVSADGNTVYKANDEEQLALVDVDLSESSRIRSSRPYTNLRRPELYE